MIDPKDVIQERTVEELCTTADQYFQLLADPTPWLVRRLPSLLLAREPVQVHGSCSPIIHRKDNDSARIWRRVMLAVENVKPISMPRYCVRRFGIGS
jgi:hypothetical protein